MNSFKSFSEKIKTGKIDDFDALAMDSFLFQSTHNKIYQKYLEARGIRPQAITEVNAIPFLPIGMFKTAKVISGSEALFNGWYSSSGTTGQENSRHYIYSKDFYLEHCVNNFESVYGSLENFHVLALLPSYLEREGSSLVDMAAHFIQKSKSVHSGFYLYEHEALLDKMGELQKDGRKTLLLGVTFALLDLAEKINGHADFGDLIVMETGGMKGRRKEMIREEVHKVLSSAFNVKHIHSEYGMTELMSQAYSPGGGKFWCSPFMRVLIRDVYDPFAYTSGTSGAINVIDLANFHSCSFIETEDLGVKNEDGSFTVLGRMDNSETRGCNLMIN
ncbi:acyl transferase [Cyclobacterium sp. 1_MG-2023]|uniref:LuxE/PaaK family acyltransferase n=1 Tax=Cyclobacterium sp. 1_MG-2023 TaxID=3062681 RepID=UPI0026E42C4B|nr:acyl transferase [Cyclobacterium sp. 1_MG-2023]MDO6438388.1 acyl transferase [Cyclobacterium sp. 1_MG-2023]